jgi:hypothetical protein
VSDDKLRALQRAESLCRLEAEGCLFGPPINHGAGGWLVNVSGPGFTTTPARGASADDALDGAIRIASMATAKRKASRR